MIKFGKYYYRNFWLLFRAVVLRRKDPMVYIYPGVVVVFSNLPSKDYSEEMRILENEVRKALMP